VASQIPPFRKSLTSRRVGNSLLPHLWQGGWHYSFQWWISDLAKELGVIAVKIHYWVKHGWIHHRRTASGKHLIVWADLDELQRLRTLADKKSSWFAAKHPELVMPKKRLAR
jgi:hypothetical protein